MYVCIMYICMYVLRNVCSQCRYVLCIYVCMFYVTYVANVGMYYVCVYGCMYVFMHAYVYVYAFMNA